MRPVGLEPMAIAWKSGLLPLHQGRDILHSPPGVGINPNRYTIKSCALCRLS